ncbi:MAG TPA: ATP-binding protein [Gemmatimonadales bacterium]|nr:ATP-binding protein [Gemmatimonadales bacterium]
MSPLVGAALVFLAALAVVWALDGWYRRVRFAEERRSVEQQIIPYGNGISLAVNRRVALVGGLRAFTELGRESASFNGGFDAYASALAATARGIRAVQLTENGIIRRTYPEAGNEAALGLDITRHPEPAVREDYARALRTGEVVVSGPVALVQGGTALIARQAVGTRPGQPSRVVALIINLEPIFAEAGLGRAAGIRLTLRDAHERVFFGADSVLALHPVETEVRLPGATWRLAAIPAAGWRSTVRAELATFRIGALLMALLLGLVTHLVMSRQAELSRAVAERTESLVGINKRLEDQIAQRELAEAQVMHMQKMEGLGRLAGGIAHDFNNILTGILGYVGLLQDMLPAGSESREDVDEIDRAARRAAELTRQLLTFARRQAVAPMTVDVNALIGEVDRILRRLIGDDVEMITDLDPGLWPVLVDRTQLEQVLTNLVVNSRDAMPGGGTITVSTCNVQIAPNRPELGHSLKVRDFVRLDVRDTGAGMDSETAARIFEPFFTTKEPGKGTGLGLAICYGIVQQAGGEIEVRTARGEGTTISVYLPRADQPVTSTLPDVLPDPTPGHETILLVEDEEMVRKFAARALSERGHPVLVASNGQEALDIAAHHQGQISLIVTDVVMPRMGGRAVADQVTAMRPGIRTLFISGHVDDPRVKDAVARDETAFLAKPFTARELLDAVRQLLD